MIFKKEIANRIVQSFKNENYYGGIARENAYKYINNRMGEEQYNDFLELTDSQIIMQIADDCGWND